MKIFLYYCLLWWKVSIKRYTPEISYSWGMRFILSAYPMNSFTNYFHLLSCISELTLVTACPSTIRGPVVSVFPSRQLSWVNIYFFNCWVDFAKDHCSVSCVVIFSMRQTFAHFGKLRRLVDSSCELLQVFTLLYSWKLFQSEDPCPGAWLCLCLSF